jgi:uracil-DNA glycosylase family 4
VTNQIVPDRGCTLCRLHKTAQTVCLMPPGPLKPATKAMIVGEAPGKREDESGKPFVGKAGGILDEMLDSQDIDRQDIFITNAVSCRPPDNRTPTKGEIKSCRHWLDYQMSVVKPKYVLILGNVPLRSITDAEGITKKRGKPFEKDGVIYLPTFHPAASLYDPAQRDFIERDFKLFKEIIDGGAVPREKKLRPTYVTTDDDLEYMLECMEGDISFDIETNCLYPWQTHNDKGHPLKAKVNVIGFGTASGEFTIPVDEWDMDEILPRIETRMRRCKVDTQNGKFDFLWMWVHYGVQWHDMNDFDDMLAHYLLDENSRHGLKELAQRYCGAPDWDVDRDTKTGVSPQLAIYHGHDLYYTRELKFIFQEMLDRDPQVKQVFDKILMPASVLYTEMQYDGLHVDIMKFGAAEKQLRKDLAAAQIKLKKWGNINWGSTKQLADLLYNKLNIPIVETTAAGNASTKESALNQIDHECVGDLIKFRHAKQQLSFFIEGWKPFLHKKRINGEWHYFLHPSIKLHGTKPGRPSSEHPNAQQIPRESIIRSLIDAPPGWELVEADLSQVEMRIAAELADESEMRNCFLMGIDIHWRTLISILEKGQANVDDIRKTAEVYCVQQGLSPDRASAEILLEVWAANSHRSETQALLEQWKARASARTGQRAESMSCMRQGISASRNGSDVLPSLREDSTKRVIDQTPNEKARQWIRPGQRRQSKRQEKSHVEGGHQPDNSGQPISERLLRALQSYEQAVRLTSQGRKSEKHEKIQFNDSLSLMSSIGPSTAIAILPDIWPERRKVSKATGFGFLYGMWHKKFRTYARDNYEINVTEQEAKDYRNTFFATYPKLSKWHERQRNFARRNGYVRSLTGRKRRLPKAQLRDDTPERREAERQAINSPVQSFASDINIMAALQIREEFNRDKVRICLTVHDSILMWVKPEWVVRVAKRVREIMQWPKLMDELGIEFTIPIDADVKIGPWSLGVSLDKWRKANAR